MLSPIQRLYYAWDIAHKKSVSDDSRFTGVLSEAKVDLNPHQVDAALFAFKSPLSKGAILADEVGLGKTIEAGIILSEMWAENKRSILIIVPASLRNQWNIELMEKFYLPSFILDSESFAEGKAQISNGQKSIYICSYNFAVSNAEYFSNIYWDLVIYDEAHKMRNVYKKSNVMANTLRSAFKDYKKVLLTATPLQNNLNELFGLISFIDQEYFYNFDTFAEQYNYVTTRDKAKYGELKDRISHIIHRTLRSQVQEYIKFTKRTAFVQEYYPSPEEVNLYNCVSDYLTREGTFGIPEKQKPLLSLLVRKIMSSSSYALAHTLDSFIQRLEKYKGTGEMTSALSCLIDECESVNEEYGFEDSDNVNNDGISQNIDAEIEELRSYRKIALQIGTETKAKKLLEALKLSFERILELGGRRKALIFTESRRTQEYLSKFLQNNGYENKVVCFNGSNNSPEHKNIYRLWQIRYAGTNRISGNPIIDKKQAIVDTFQNDAEIMIATEAGAEGINLQFCSLVVNYDMPWNPQRIEQRIGRCHRYGQKNDVVVINFVNQVNYADCRVYELLNDKFSLFNGVLGASDEVLGAIDSGVDFEKRLNAIYNTCRTEREIKAAFDELQAEMDSIIKERIKDTKKTLLENFDEEVINKLRMRQSTDEDRMDLYSRHLWKVATSVLNACISKVDDSKHIFTLTSSLAEDIPAATYILNKDSEQYIQLRYSHPLGQYVIKKALAGNADDSSLVFNLDSYGYRTTMIEPYKGKCGSACVYRVSSNNEYDREEMLIGCAQTDDGEELPQEFVFKLLELDCNSCNTEPLDWLETRFKDSFEKQLSLYTTKLDKKNNEYVNYEINKYEMWSDDQLVPLKKEIEALSKEQEALKRKIRRETDSQLKIILKKEENQKGRILNQKRAKYYELSDDYADKVDKMTEKLQASMKNNISANIMFKFNWKIV